MKGIGGCFPEEIAGSLMLKRADGCKLGTILAPTCRRVARGLILTKWSQYRGDKCAKLRAGARGDTLAKANADRRSADCVVCGNTVHV